MVKKQENERPNINRIEKEWTQIIKGSVIMLMDCLIIVKFLFFQEKMP
jgi:hypothetical protein